MSVFALIPVGAWILVFFVLVYVYAQPRIDSLHRAFVLVAAFILGWISLELLFYLPLSAGQERFILKGIGLFWIPLGVVFLNFIYKLLGRKLDRFFFFCVVLAAVGVAIDHGTDWVLNGFERRYWGTADMRGPLHTPMTLVPSLPTLYGLWLVLRALRRSSPLMRPVHSLVLRGGLVGFSTAMGLNMALPNLLHIDVLPRFGSSALGLFCLAIYIAVRRHEFLTVSVEQAAEDIFASSQDGLVLLDGDGRVARLNPAAKSILALTDEHSRPELSERPTLEELLPNMEGDASSLTVTVGRDQDERHYLVSRTLLATREGKKRGEVLVLRDISALKQAEQVLRRSRDELEAEVQRRTEELRQAQKMEEIGRLAGGVAHDFNNLLAVIIGFATAARDDLDENHPIRVDLDEILCAADNGRRTVQQLLAFSRKAKAQSVPFNVASAVKEALRLFCVSLPPSVAVRSSIEEGPFRILGDSTQLQQVLINLLSNAVYAMRNTDGTIDVRLARVELDTVTQVGRAQLLPGSYVRIEVSDQGTGMGPETIDRLFEPFFTTKPKGEGTGLGLATALGIVESHGGTLSVTSEVGLGSTFTIHLPLLRGDRASIPPEEEEKTPSGSERLLLVDDEDRVLRGLRRLVESLGYFVEATNSSEQALEWLRDKPQRCDLLLTDQAMPSLTGLELAQAAREIRGDLPVILLSGYSTAITDERLVEVGVSAFLRKPVHKTELGQAIRSALDAARAAREADQDVSMTRSTAAI